MNNQIHLGPSISGTKHDRDNTIFFAERQGQSNHENMDPIGLKISKMGVITAEPAYHAQVWEYPPQVLNAVLLI